MTIKSSYVYKKKNILNAPAYTLAEASRYLHIAAPTLRSWVVGRRYPLERGKGFFRPLIQLPNKSKGLLSFENLVEAHVLRALRTEQGVPIRAVRDALKFSEKKLNIERLLLSHELYTSAGELFLERYGQLINLSKSGQLALKEVLKSYLSRIEWDHNIPIRLYPFIGDYRTDGKVIAIDPYISFGRPIIFKKGISTAIIVDRIDAGETVKDLAKDYDLDESEVEKAIVYERAA